jgi:hypothetical protein
MRGYLLLGISFLIVTLLLPLHEKLHQLGFSWGGYDSEIRLWHNPPHVIARNQHIDADTWITMEIAPAIGVGIVLFLFTPPVAVIAGAEKWDTLIFTIVVLFIHIGGSAGDLYNLWRFKRNYSNDATAYIVDTVDNPESGPFKIYYCPPEHTDSQ